MNSTASLDILLLFLFLSSCCLLNTCASPQFVVAFGRSPEFIMGREKIASDIMKKFASRTGISHSSTQPDGSKRYLWTDAFAVCNFLGLENEQMALDLVHSVHENLGRFRPDDAIETRRLQWMSGDSQQPTARGLRIGKSRPERGPNEPINERAEWDQDGQYFHYLTKWIMALVQVASYTKDAHYLEWAIDLMKASKAFVYSKRGQDRMYWKMSTDLSRPLVMSMGAQDPLDGYVTAAMLSYSIQKLPTTQNSNFLEPTEKQFKSMIHISATSDSLGIGGMLADVYRIHQLYCSGAKVDLQLLIDLMDSCVTSLNFFSKSDELHEPAQYRLAFRELGLSIGLHAMELMNQQQDSLNPKVQARLDKILKFAPMAQEIEGFWLNGSNQGAKTWKDHLDINEVMLATSLAPNGFLRMP